jgi:hypothetical protein
MEIRCATTLSFPEGQGERALDGDDSADTLDPLADNSHAQGDLCRSVPQSATHII